MQEEKIFFVNKGYGFGEGLCFMIIYEVQGLICDSVIIINIKLRRFQVYNSVLYVVVVVLRYMNSCVYYFDDVEDVIGCFVKKVMDVLMKMVVDYNLKMVM